MAGIIFRDETRWSNRHYIACFWCQQKYVARKTRINIHLIYEITWVQCCKSYIASYSYSYIDIIRKRTCSRYKLQWNKFKVTRYSHKITLVTTVTNFSLTSLSHSFVSVLTIFKTLTVLRFHLEIQNHAQQNSLSHVALVGTASQINENLPYLPLSSITVWQRGKNTSRKCEIGRQLYTAISAKWFKMEFIVRVGNFVSTIYVRNCSFALILILL